MKIRTTSNAPDYVRKFQRAIVASAIATFLGACAGGTDEETGNGGIAGTTPDIGAAVEAIVDSDTDLVVPGSGSGVELTPGTDSASVDSVVEISEGAQTDVEVDSTMGTVEIPEVESTNSVPDNALGLIQSHPDLGLFATAIQFSGLVDYLSDPEQQVTVFAVSDRAFESLSAIQRDGLFNDPDRLKALVRATTIPERRILESAAGVIDDMQAFDNEEMKLERDGELITLAGRLGDQVAVVDRYENVNSTLLQAAVEVTDSLLSSEAAVHVIDGFINIDKLFFPPDPGSITALLLEDENSRFSFQLRYSRWFRELGNSESAWTVFSPINGDSFELETHIVASEGSDPVFIETGTVTAVDGSPHEIGSVDDALIIDDIDISELNAFQANNGHVHRITWPLGAEVYMSVHDLVEQYGSDQYDIGTESGADPVPDTGGSYYGGDNYVPKSYSTSLRFDFFEKLILSLDEIERFDGRANRITLVIPDLAETAVEHEQRIAEHKYYGTLTMYDAFYYSRSNESFSMVPDIFPDMISARNFLLAHTFEGVLTREKLENSVNGYLQTAAGSVLAITEVPNSDSTDIYIGGQLMDSDSSRVPAANGGILFSATAFAETPDFSRWSSVTGENQPPAIDVQPVTTTMQSDPDGFEKAVNAFASSFGGLQKLDDSDDSDPWTVFFPSDTAYGDADASGDLMIVPGMRLSPEDLIANGQVTTFYGQTFLVGGTDAESLTIGGAPAIVLGGEASIVYKLTVLPE